MQIPLEEEEMAFSDLKHSQEKITHILSAMDRMSVKCMITLVKALASIRYPIANTNPAAVTRRSRYTVELFELNVSYLQCLG